jgi:hypothetical protein
MKIKSEILNHTTFTLCGFGSRRMGCHAPCHLRAIHIATALAGLVLGSSSFGANLLTNGSFESGNSGFGSDLAYISAPPFGFATDGVYGIGRNPSQWYNYPPWASWSDMGDHTTGAGNMLIATPYVGSYKIWFENVDVAVGTTYMFSGWATYVSYANPAMLSINASGTSLGTLDLASLQQGQWGQFSFGYTAGTSGTVVFSITDLSSTTFGNDFALDDLTLTLVPEPGSMTLLGLGCAALMLVQRRGRP